MTISELIEKLEYYEKEYGDLGVRHCETGYTFWNVYEYEGSVYIG